MHKQQHSAFHCLHYKVVHSRRNTTSIGTTAPLPRPAARQHAMLCYPPYCFIINFITQIDRCSFPPSIRLPLLSLCFSAHSLPFHSRLLLLYYYYRAYFFLSPSRLCKSRTVGIFLYVAMNRPRGTIVDFTTSLLLLFLLNKHHCIVFHDGMKQYRGVHVTAVAGWK